jgi:predicted nucleic acid-binding protein
LESPDCRQAKDARSWRKKAASAFAALPCEPIPERAGDSYAALKLIRQQRGLTIDENDLWVAATALALGATLVSRDRDFEGIDGLSVVALD